MLKKLSLILVEFLRISESICLGDDESIILNLFEEEEGEE